MDSGKLHDTKSTRKNQCDIFIHNNELTEKEIGRVPFTLTSKRTNYLWINVTECMKL